MTDSCFPSHLPGGQGKRCFSWGNQEKFPAIGSIVWYTLLPLAEFTYNNTPSTTTSISPFFANKGYHPNLTVHPKHDLASVHAKDLVVNLDKLHQELKTTIAKAQRRYQGPADAKRMPAPDFIIRQQAFVKAKFFCTTRPSHKLPTNSLDRTRFLPKLDLIPIHSISPTQSVVFTPFSMSPC